MSEYTPNETRESFLAALRALMKDAATLAEIIDRDRLLTEDKVFHDQIKSVLSAYKGLGI